MDSTEPSENDADCPDADSSDVSLVDDEHDELLQLEPREIVKIIRQLKVELARKKNILNFFETISQTLAEKRDDVVTVLDFIDNICSTRSNLEELDRRSIAATARPYRIDHKWGKQVASSDATANRWTSVKPRPLQSIPTTSPPGPSQLPTAPTTASSYKAVATTTESTEPAPRNNTKTKRENKRKKKKEN